MKHKVSELEGALLDAAVALAEPSFRLVKGRQETWVETEDQSEEGGLVGYIGGHHVPQFAPSTDWQQGGPIIQREHIYLDPLDDGGGRWMAGIPPQYHASPLVAAMRAYCTSVFGDEVELPDASA